ncbi:MAG: polyprenyl synthetase family protein [Deltaproteobacteria bacterium]|nr:MAG: polyprenyl synthetase family protein [Deltaproteobacteria bacterium]
MEASDFEAYLVGEGRAIDEALERFVDRIPQVAILRAGVSHALGLDREGGGGKRLRPALSLLTCVALGGKRAQAMPFALAMELLHSFLLVHDDIEDGDRIRRNRPAVWVRFGMAQGINIGDYLFCKAYEAVLSLRNHGLPDERVLALLALLTETVAHTGEGQALDLEARARRDLCVEDYMRIVTAKTGDYLIAPAIGGAMIAGADPSIIAALTAFGRCIGPAFQIIDDVIDLTSGKGRGEPGSDIREGKRSFLVVETAARARPDERDRLFEILDKPRQATSTEDIETVTALFEKYGAVARARAKARALCAEGKEYLAPLPPPLARMLATAADFFTERHH